MKPQRNLVYCPSAKKHKQLFQSEKEAMAFIKYNSEEIKEAFDEIRMNGVDPFLRAIILLE